MLWFFFLLFCCANQSRVNLALERTKKKLYTYCVIERLLIISCITPNQEKNRSDKCIINVIRFSPVRTHNVKFVTSIFENPFYFSGPTWILYVEFLFFFFRHHHIITINIISHFVAFACVGMFAHADFTPTPRGINNLRTVNFFLAILFYGGDDHLSKTSTSCGKRGIEKCWREKKSAHTHTQYQLGYNEYKCAHCARIIFHLSHQSRPPENIFRTNFKKKNV